MAKGIGPSPWVWQALDYVGDAIRISVNFDDVTHALVNVGGACATVHRDTGCQYTKIVLDNPTDGVKAKRLAAPADGAADATYNVAQLSHQGLTTIDDVLAVQITAEP